MQTATPSPLTADTAAPLLRTARDQYFDQIFGGVSALKPDTASWSHIAQAPFNPADLTRIPELPANPDRTILTASFSSFKSVLSQSQRCIYTEINFSVDRTFQSATASLASGAAITVIIPGGSVQTGTGTLSYLADPQKFFIQPGNKYLLVLSYDADGDFYTLVKDWTVSGGALQPDSALEQARAAAGKSSLAGISESQIASAIAPLLLAAR